MSETGPDEGYESPSRYERSFPGMVGAMIVTLAVIGVFVAFRAINRDELTVPREPVDYLPAVADIQEGAPFRIAYPPDLPEDWLVTESPGFDDEVGLTWTIDLLTDDGDYVGVRQARATETALLDRYVDEEAIEGDELTLGGLAPTWQAWSDVQGDYAVLTEVGQTVLIVFGTAGEAEVEEFAASLVTERVR